MRPPTTGIAEAALLIAASKTSEDLVGSLVSIFLPKPMGILTSDIGLPEIIGMKFSIPIKSDRGMSMLALKFCAKIRP
jgi:hypothetical protein